MTLGDNIFVTSSCSFDGNRPPDSWAFGFVERVAYRCRRSIVLSFLACNSNLPHLTFLVRCVTCQFLVEPGKCNLSPALAWILLAWVIGLLNLVRPVSRDLGNAFGRQMPWLGCSWPVTSDCELLSCRTAASARTLVTVGFDFDFDDAPA